MPQARIVWHARQASVTCLEIGSSLGLHASCCEAVRGEAEILPRMSALATCSEGADPMALVWGACRAARDYSRFACIPHLSFKRQSIKGCSASQTLLRRASARIIHRC